MACGETETSQFDDLNGVAAEIKGVDVSRLTEGQGQFVDEIFARYGVVFFRNQSLTPAQHVAFSERWGEASVHPFLAKLEDQPKVALVTKEPHQKDNIGGGWHADHTFEHNPALGSVLVARELPNKGGDTLFASMYKAYDGLPETMKQELEGLRAVHSAKHIFGGSKDSHFANIDVSEEQASNAYLADEMSDPAHPIVVEHPLSGRKALFVNPGFTIRLYGETYEASKSFLENLYALAIKPENTYRFQWEPGSVAMWDNRASWHFAINDYHGERREMHRVTIKGGPVE